MFQKIDNNIIIDKDILKMLRENGINNFINNQEIIELIKKLNNNNNN